MSKDNEEEDIGTIRHLGGSSTSSTPTEEPTLKWGGSTEPLEMMGGSVTPRSVPNISVR
jgi:hypothetical protein